MKIKLSSKIKKLAYGLPCSLYVVGGYVRNFLTDGTYSSDIDLAAPISVEELLPYLEKEKFAVLAVYKNTGTVKFGKGVENYEFTSFRTDSYRKGGKHTPDSVTFTDDIKKDALRRDFTCNAIYYDIGKDEIVDPLFGVEDVKNRRLKTVTLPEEVFSHDGLRLMRLARLAAELDFVPEAETLKAAKKCAKNIKDVSAERIYDEIKKIFVSDFKYSFSAKDGCVKGLKILKDIGVFEIVFSEIDKAVCESADTSKKKDALYTEMFSALPFVGEKNRLFAFFYAAEKLSTENHIEKSSQIFGAEVLKRLKADKKTVNTVRKLNSVCGIFEKNKTEAEIREGILCNYGIIETLFEIENAVALSKSCGKEDSQTVKKWR
ncbi:MAG: CCA tRNA nucleotidyltransferase, partial [Clostridia bacterium]|nr:CCA tRNA nucleotidyltransferase [Clostridia bacterium]